MGKFSVKGKILDKAERTDIPPDFIVGMPVIRMASNREIFIEDSGFLDHYDKDCIKLRQRKTFICVNGKNLKLKFLADNNVRIVGYISSVCFENRE